MSSHMNDDYDREIRLHRIRKIEEMRRRKEQQILIRKMIRKAAPILLCVVSVFIIIGVSRAIGHTKDVNDGIEGNESNAIEDNTLESNIVEGNTDNTVLAQMGKNDEDEAVVDVVQKDAVQKPAPKSYSFQTTENTRHVGEDIISSYAILVDTDTNNIVTQREARTRINPASMTKILTILVAAEHVTNLDDTFTITADITDYGFIHDCSSTGFEIDETVTVRDMFYGTILPSGADSAMGLAVYVSGSQEKFVELMNDKLNELGISDTAHFTNCVGIYDVNHYCSVYDMAIILRAALDNELCKEVLSAHTYTTSITEQHPEGLTISNWFLRRIEDKDAGGEVLCGKTGFVLQSGNCSASYGVESSGKGYICVTANANSGWRCIYDHVALYKQYMN